MPQRKTRARHTQLKENRKIKERLHSIELLSQLNVSWASLIKVEETSITDFHILLLRDLDLLLQNLEPNLNLQRVMKWYHMTKLMICSTNCNKVQIRPLIIQLQL